MKELEPLPTELIYAIVSYCEARTVLAVCTINKTWYAVCMCPTVWKQLFYGLRISHRNVTNYIQTYQRSLECQLVPTSPSHNIEFSQNHNTAVNKTTNTYTRLRKTIRMEDILNTKLKQISMSYHFRVEVLSKRGWVSIGWSTSPTPRRSNSERCYGATTRGLEPEVKTGNEIGLKLKFTRLSASEYKMEVEHYVNGAEDRGGYGWTELQELTATVKTSDTIYIMVGLFEDIKVSALLTSAELGLQKPGKHRFDRKRKGQQKKEKFVVGRVKPAEGRPWSRANCKRFLKESDVRYLDENAIARLHA